MSSVPEEGRNNTTTHGFRYENIRPSCPNRPSRPSFRPGQKMGKKACKGFEWELRISHSIMVCDLRGIEIEIQYNHQFQKNNFFNSRYIMDHNGMWNSQFLLHCPMFYHLCRNLKIGFLFEIKNLQNINRISFHSDYISE